MPARRAHVTGLVALVLAAGVAAPAAAVQQVTYDSAGRPITFDVRDPAADVAGYTAILDGLLHGAEISDVVVTVVPQSAIASECGSGAAACYRWSSRGGAAMFVPSLPSQQVRGTLGHEYGHHVDATRPHVVGARGLDGTARWWGARGMAGLLAQGSVAWDYSLGWDRAIAEVFAEDYAVTNVGRSSSIRWLGDPPAAVAEAIRADLAGATVPPAPPSGAPQPPPAPATAGPSTPSAAAGVRLRTIARASGRLAAGRRVRIGFAVGSAGRLAVRIGGATAGRVRAVLRCAGTTLGGGAARRGRPGASREMPGHPAGPRRAEPVPRGGHGPTRVAGEGRRVPEGGRALYDAAAQVVEDAGFPTDYECDLRP
jgi:hypothetical protein